MGNLKITLIEDNDEAINTFRRTCRIYSKEKSIEIDIESYKTVRDFKNNLEEILTCDGIVVDMKLDSANGEEAGNGTEIIEFFANQKIIIPTIIYTGTDDVALINHPFITIRRKGDSDIKNDILEEFHKIKSTGIIDIIGGQGILKEYLYDVFHKNIDKQKDHWFAYSQEDSKRTRNALLRHTINHLTQYLDEEDKNYYLEEMYIYPPIAEKVKPGSIITNNSDHKTYIILTPACDLAQEKAHCILLCEIVSPKALIASKVPGEGNSKTRQKELKRFTGNSNPNYHFLPPMVEFPGGFVDFASVISVSPQDLRDNFSKTKIQVSNAFIVDITARFSIYYSRQGQPDLNHQDEYFTDILTETPYVKPDTSLSAPEKISTETV